MNQMRFVGGRRKGQGARIHRIQAASAGLSWRKLHSIILTIIQLQMIDVVATV